jgi:hypothetical protein
MVMTKQADGVRRTKKDNGEAAKQNWIYAKAPAIPGDSEQRIGYTEQQPDRKWKGYPEGGGAWPSESMANHGLAVDFLLTAWNNAQGSSGKDDTAMATDGGEQVTEQQETDDILADPQTMAAIAEGSEGVEAPADGSWSPAVTNEPVVVDVDPTQGGGPSTEDPPAPDAGQAATTGRPETAEPPAGDPDPGEYGTVMTDTDTGEKTVVQPDKIFHAEPSDKQKPEREEAIEAADQPEVRSAGQIPEPVFREPVHADESSRERANPETDPAARGPFSDPFGDPWSR